MDNDIKYPISFIKTCCNFLPKTQRKISFKLMNVYQANSLHSSGYYVIMYAYTLFRNLDIFSLKVPQENIGSNIISFFETNEISSFQCLPPLHETKPDVYLDFQEMLYCHCRGPDLGKRMKQCNRCLDWFHEDCESFDDVDQNVFPNHCFDRYRVPFTVLKCLNCYRNFKPKTGYWRHPRGSTAINCTDNHVSS